MESVFHSRTRWYLSLAKERARQLQTSGALGAMCRGWAAAGRQQHAAGPEQGLSLAFLILLVVPEL